MTTPKYRTDAKACSCPGYWYRRTCRHYRAYGEAMALVVEQDKANKAFSSQGATSASWEKSPRAVEAEAIPSPVMRGIVSSALQALIPERVLRQERLIEEQERNDVYARLLR